MTIAIEEALKYVLVELHSLLRSFMLWVLSAGPIPSHIAIIMDGNRRFADRIHVNRWIGHIHGYQALMLTLKDCFDLHVKTVSLYAFSIDNFSRPPDEVSALMDLMQNKLESLIEKEGLARSYGIRVRVLGDLSLLPEGVQKAAEKVMDLTRHNNNAVLNLFVSYSSSHEIVRSAQRIRDRFISSFAHALDLDKPEEERICATKESREDYQTFFGHDQGLDESAEKMVYATDKSQDDFQYSFQHDVYAVESREKAICTIKEVQDERQSSFGHDVYPNETCTMKKLQEDFRPLIWHDVETNKSEENTRSAMKRTQDDLQSCCGLDVVPNKLWDKVIRTTKRIEGDLRSSSGHDMDPDESSETTSFMVDLHRALEKLVSEEEIERHLYTESCSPPDLLIRTSGETRLSNFMLWQTAFSHLTFCRVLWPEFSLKDLFFIILDYQRAYPALLRKQQSCRKRSSTVMKREVL